MDCVGDNTLSP